MKKIIKISTKSKEMFSFSSERSLSKREIHMKMEWREVKNRELCMRILGMVGIKFKLFPGRKKILRKLKTNQLRSWSALWMLKIKFWRGLRKKLLVQVLIQKSKNKCRIYYSCKKAQKQMHKNKPIYFKKEQMI